MTLAKRSKLVRIDPALEDVFNKFKKAGKVETFPEFSRLVAEDIKIKKKNLRFFK